MWQALQESQWLKVPQESHAGLPGHELAYQCCGNFQDAIEAAPSIERAELFTRRIQCSQHVRCRHEHPYRPSRHRTSRHRRRDDHVIARLNIRIRATFRFLLAGPIPTLFVSRRRTLRSIILFRFLFLLRSCYLARRFLAMAAKIHRSPCTGPCFVVLLQWMNGFSGSTVLWSG